MGILSRTLLLMAPRRTVKAAFTRHFERRDWGEPETVSGRGSSLRCTDAIRRQLPALFAEFGIQRVTDAGCGDFHWLRELGDELPTYVGIEVVDALAADNQKRFGSDRRRFVSLDIIRDPIPPADLILCRDCLVHLKNTQVRAALRNFVASGSRYLLATTYTERHLNDDVSLGGWRPINLAKPPFDLGPPLRLISEDGSLEDPALADKALGLWPLLPCRSAAQRP